MFPTSALAWAGGTVFPRLSRLRAKDVLPTYGLGLLQLLRGVGDDGAVVLLGARARGGDHGTRRNELRGVLMPRVLHLPDVFVQPRLCRDYLAAVDDRAAAHGEDEVDALVAHQPRALLHLVVGRVGQDAAEVHHRLTALVQPVHHLVIQSRAPQRAAAVGQQHAASHTFHLFLDCALGPPLPKCWRTGYWYVKLFIRFLDVIATAKVCQPPVPVPTRITVMPTNFDAECGIASGVWKSFRPYEEICGFPWKFMPAVLSL